MNGLNDNVQLPFSVLDPILGDLFSILLEPNMIREKGSALEILKTKVDDSSTGNNPYGFDFCPSIAGSVCASFLSFLKHW